MLSFVAFAVLAAIAVQPVPTVSVVDAVAPAGAAAGLPARTPVMLRVEKALSSRTNVRGDTFPIVVAYDVRDASGRVIISAGSTGMGEVIHAAKKGWGGRAGELLLAARYIEVNGERVRLEALRLGRAGEQQVDTAMLAGLAVPIASFFITGTSAEVIAGQIAQARLIEAFSPKEP